MTTVAAVTTARYRVVVEDGGTVRIIGDITSAYSAALNAAAAAASAAAASASAAEAEANAPVQSVFGRTGAVTLQSSDVTTALAYTPQNTAAKGQANGYAGLDASGLVPAAQLPSFVDDVLEYANVAAFPATGTAGIIYVALDTGRSWRWSGSAYTEIIASPGTTDAITEGASNLFFTDARALAAIQANDINLGAHSLTAGAATFASLIATGLITAASTSGFAAGNFFAYDSAGVARAGAAAGSNLRLYSNGVNAVDFDAAGTPTFNVGANVTGAFSNTAVASIGGDGTTTNRLAVTGGGVGSSGITLATAGPDANIDFTFDAKGGGGGYYFRTAAGSTVLATLLPAAMSLNVPLNVTGDVGILNLSATSTGAARLSLMNDGGQSFFGINNSDASAYGGTAYSTVIYAPAGRVVETSIAGTGVITKVSAGGLTVTGNALVNGGVRTPMASGSTYAWIYADTQGLTNAANIAANWVGSQENLGYPSWLLTLDVGNDVAKIRRAAAGGGSATDVAVFSSGGSLGLGVTPKGGSGIAMLQLANGGIVSVSGSQNNFAQNVYQAGGAWKYMGGGIEAALYQQASGGHVFYTAAAGSADAAISWSAILGLAANGHAGLAATGRLYLDGVAAAGNTYLVESSADVLDLYAGANRTLRLESAGAKVAAADSSTIFGVVGGTLGIRLGTSPDFASISGVDSTLVNSYQPLKVNGYTVTLQASNTDIATASSDGLTVTGELTSGGIPSAFSRVNGTDTVAGVRLQSSAVDKVQLAIASGATYLDFDGSLYVRNGINGNAIGVFSVGGFSVGAGGTGDDDASITINSGSGAAGESILAFSRGSSAAALVYHDGSTFWIRNIASSNVLVYGTVNFGIGGTAKLYLDGGGDTYVTESSANVLDMYAGGTKTLSLTTAGGAFTGTVSTTDPAGGAGPAWKLGVAAAVSPTSPDRTLRVDIAGTSYYIAAKTTND